MARSVQPVALHPLRLMRRAHPAGAAPRAGAKRMLFLCCGNADRGDDGAGPACADALRLLGVPAKCVAGDAFSLIDAWKGHDEVAIVDCIATAGALAGTVHRYEVQDGAGVAEFERALGGSTHGLGVVEAFRLGRLTKSVPRRAVIHAIEAASFEWGAGLSREVHEAVQKLATRLAAEFEARKAAAPSAAARVAGS